LRKPASPYENGRSPFLVKVKDGRDEIEALAMDVFAGGSVQLKLYVFLFLFLFCFPYLFPFHSFSILI
jgi:hypothetical protein